MTSSPLLVLFRVSVIGKISQYVSTETRVLETQLKIFQISTLRISRILLSLSQRRKFTSYKINLYKKNEKEIR